MTFLSLSGLSKRFGPATALADIELAVPEGSRTAIVGPSGSGKTTLLRIVAGFDAPDTGTIVLDGRILADGTRTVPAHRRGIGFVPQDGALFPHLSIAENIGFGIDRRALGRDERIRQLGDTVELDRDMLGRRPHQLSGGQQQRVALARALAGRPKFMLLDEPFSALDASLRDSMRRVVVRALRAAGTTSILVTHDQAEALSFADQVAVLREGRLVQVGSPRELYSTPKDPGTAAFLGDAIVLPAQLGDGFADCRLGRIAADTSGRRGPAEIMLRPEQLHLVPVPGKPQQANSDQGIGTVVDVAFSGAVSVVAVAMPPAPVPVGRAIEGSDDPLLVRSPSVDLPPIGARVRIAVRGPVHIFDR